MASEALNAIEALLSRRSVPALQLRAPGPGAAQIDTAIDAAQRAPDHGALRPWRFVLIRGAARERLAQLFVQRMQERDPAIPSGKLDKARMRLQAAPLVIAVGARIVSGHKVPEQEQLLSVGAAVMNLLNAFHAQGYGAIWLTGDNAYDRVIATQLGFSAEERCVGFVYVGSIDAQPPAQRRVPRATIVREWSG